LQRRKMARIIGINNSNEGVFNIQENKFLATGFWKGTGQTTKAVRDTTNHALASLIASRIKNLRLKKVPSFHRRLGKSKVRGGGGKSPEKRHVKSNRMGIWGRRIGSIG